MWPALLVSWRGPGDYWTGAAVMMRRPACTSMAATVPGAKPAAASQSPCSMSLDVMASRGLRDL